MITAFAFINLLHDSASAPYESPLATEPAEIKASPSPEIPDEEDEQEGESDEPDEPDEPEDIPEDEPVEYVDVGFVTVHMEEADINRGYLILVNPEHSFEIPESLGLVNIVDEKTAPFRVLGEHYLLVRSVVGPLDAMMADFLAEYGYNTIAVISGYRSYNAQQSVLDRYIARMGRSEALKWVALPGHSEHHTGLAVDLGIYSGGVQSTFTGTGITSWYRRNSYKYGFILRYPQDKTRITKTNHEPWHFRYVGLPHSYIMFQNNWVFEEYINMLRGYSIDEPFIAEHNGRVYEIYFTADTDVPVPYDSMFDISGNNVDGFIVTTYRPDADEALLIDFYADYEEP